MTSLSAAALLSLPAAFAQKYVAAFQPVAIGFFNATTCAARVCQQIALQHHQLPPDMEGLH